MHSSIGTDLWDHHHHQDGEHIHLPGIWAALGKSRARTGHGAWYWAQRPMVEEPEVRGRPLDPAAEDTHRSQPRLTTASCVARSESLPSWASVSSFVNLGVMIDLSSLRRDPWDSTEPGGKVLCKLWKVSPGQGIRPGSSPQHTGNAQSAGLFTATLSSREAERIGNPSQKWPMRALPCPVAFNPGPVTKCQGFSSLLPPPSSVWAVFIYQVSLPPESSMWPHVTGGFLLWPGACW